MAETDDRLPSLRNRAMLVEQAIRSENYYTLTWDFITRDLVRLEHAETAVAILKRFQLFWEALPDSRSIHRPPFGEICALAEEYCLLDPEALERTVDQTVTNALARGAHVHIVGEKKDD